VFAKNTGQGNGHLEVKSLTGTTAIAMLLFSNELDAYDGGSAVAH
jgi:hypothetical protein